MKIIKFFILFLMLNTFPAFSNNVQVSNVRLTGQDTVNNFTMVEFDISWENSWRYANGPANWDAAWIFVKYRIGTSGQWQHAWLNNTGHITCGNSTINNGFLSPELPYNSSTNPSLGVFLYRSSAGSGTFSCQDIQLRWNYGNNSVDDEAQVDIKVFAIEMVYVPEGPFKAGDGHVTGGTLYEYNPSGFEVPFFIDSENEIMVGAINGQLYYDNDSGTSGDRLGPIPSTYPKGYKGFYIMKYEITQQGYVDFLNTLNRTQQASRVRSDISGTSVTNQFVMVNNTFHLGNGIWTYNFIPPAPGPVLFSCNYSNNAIPGEPGDGQTMVCGFLLLGDFSAYLDWAALRPMTELEFEKSGRGPLPPVQGEYAWGNNFIRHRTQIYNIGFPNATADTLTNVNVYNSPGTMRAGMFAHSGTDRTFSGAGFYGAMELTGNIWEKVITLGNPSGRSYTGTHGNGLLDASGNANANSWPDPSNGLGAGHRGGGNTEFFTHPTFILSNRVLAASENIEAYVSGGRGVRTAQ